jgi:hypothetical protein
LFGLFYQVLVKFFLVFALFIPSDKEQSFPLGVKNIGNPKNMSMGLWPQFLEIGQLLVFIL